MANIVVNPTVTKPGRWFGKKSSYFTGYIDGGPQLVLAMIRLGNVVSGLAAKTGVEAMGEVIRAEWQSLVPVDDGHYRRSLSKGAVKSLITRNGATGSIRTMYLADLPDREQPYHYSSVLEFGGRVGPKIKGKGTGHYIAPQPSARPAMDRKAGAAVDEAADQMRRIIYFSLAAQSIPMPRVTRGMSFRAGMMGTWP